MICSPLLATTKLIKARLEHRVQAISQCLNSEDSLPSVRDSHPSFDRATVHEFASHDAEMRSH